MLSIPSKATQPKSGRVDIDVVSGSDVAVVVVNSGPIVCSAVDVACVVVVLSVVFVDFLEIVVKNVVVIFVRGLRVVVSS
jgi:hypothetical protein